MKFESNLIFLKIAYHTKNPDSIISTTSVLNIFWYAKYSMKYKES
jgi:hypothetical protein